jgi:hypothetical protein
MGYRFLVQSIMPVHTENVESQPEKRRVILPGSNQRDGGRWNKQGAHGKKNPDLLALSFPHPSPTAGAATDKSTICTQRRPDRDRATAAAQMRAPPIGGACMSSLFRACTVPLHDISGRARVEIFSNFFVCRSYDALSQSFKRCNLCLATTVV